MKIMSENITSANQVWDYIRTKGIEWARGVERDAIRDAQVGRPAMEKYWCGECLVGLE
jgi:hypothetical protein